MLFQQDPACVGCGISSNVRLHYGSPSCHGCKAFFRRSVTRNLQYKCMRQNNCNTTKEARNCCRACRLRRCLQNGMKVELVREERGKRAIKLDPDEIKIEPDEPFIPPVVMKRLQQQSVITDFLCILEHKIEMLTDADALFVHNQGSMWTNDVVIEEVLQNPNSATKRSPMDWNCYRLIQTSDLYSQWHRNIVYFADWALGLPEFRNLPKRDQVNLFKKNYIAFGWLTFCYKCVGGGHDTLGMPMGNGSYIPFTREGIQMLELPYAKAFVPLMKYLADNVIKPMKRIHMTFEEHCLLKILCLFQPEAFEDFEPFMLMREQVLAALANHIEVNFSHLTPTERIARASNIMLLIPVLNTANKMELELLSDNLPPKDLEQLGQLFRDFTL